MDPLAIEYRMYHDKCGEINKKHVRFGHWFLSALYKQTSRTLYSREAVITVHLGLWHPVTA